MKTFKLIELCEIIKGKTPIKKAVAGNYPLVVTAEERLTCNEYQFDDEVVCIPLVSSSGHGKASINRLHFQTGKFALGNILCGLISKNKNVLNPMYLYIYLSIYKDDLLVPLMKGSANVSLSISKLNDVNIIVPDIDIQNDIVEKYNLFTKKLSIITNKLNFNKMTLDILKKKVYQEIILSSEDKQQKVNIKELCSIKTGKKDANYGNTLGEYNFYTCAMEPLKCDDYSFSGESIILPGNGANVGLSIYYDGDFEAYQRTYVLQKKDSEYKFNMKYLYYHMMGYWYDYNKDKQFGSATPYIKLGNVENYELNLPSLNTQNLIVDNITKIEQIIFEIESKMEENIIFSDLLLKKFFNEIIKQ